MLSVIGYAFAGVKGSVAWLAGIWQSIAATTAAISPDVPSRWVSLGLTAMLVSALVASIAAYFIFVDE
jgi:hypothetical protein